MLANVSELREAAMLEITKGIFDSSPFLMRSPSSKGSGIPASRPGVLSTSLRIDFDEQVSLLDAQKDNWDVN